MVTRSFLAAALIFFSFSRGRAENFIVELEGGVENKESFQGKIVVKSLKSFFRFFKIFKKRIRNAVEEKLF